MSQTSRVIFCDWFEVHILEQKRQPFDGVGTSYSTIWTCFHHSNYSYNSCNLLLRFTSHVKRANAKSWLLVKETPNMGNQKPRKQLECVDGSSLPMSHNSAEGYWKCNGVQSSLWHAIEYHQTKHSNTRIGFRRNHPELEWSNHNPQTSSNPGVLCGTKCSIPKPVLLACYITVSSASVCITIQHQWACRTFYICCTTHTQQTNTLWPTIKGPVAPENHKNWLQQLIAGICCGKW